MELRAAYPTSEHQQAAAAIVDFLLNLPELYERLPRLFEIKHFESLEIGEKACEVEQLLEQYAPAPD